MGLNTATQATMKGFSQKDVQGLVLSAPASQTIRILLLDDDPMFGKRMEREAQARNVQLISCCDVREFLKRQATGHYDIVAIDYFLRAGSNGIRVAQKVMGTPVVMMSGSQRWTRKQSLWPISVRAFLNKKMHARDLLDSIVHIGEQCAQS